MCYKTDFPSSIKTGEVEWGEVQYREGGGRVFMEKV